MSKTKLQMVKEFNNEVVKMESVKVAKCIAPQRVEWFLNCVKEELEEFNTAYKEGDCVGMLDALADMTYFILGRVQECGFTERQWDKAFQIVHECNMNKHSGNKGRGSDVDAVKDKDWVGPESQLQELIGCNRECPEDDDLIRPHRAFDEIDAMIYGTKEDKKSWQTEEMEKLDEHISPVSCDEGAVMGIQHRGPSVYVDLANGEQLILSKEDLEIVGNMSKAFFEVTKLSMKKSQDYNNGNCTPTSRAVYFPFGLLSYAQMLHTKSQRLNSLAQQDKMPNNESVRDTLLDMINYASFAVDAIDKGEI